MLTTIKKPHFSLNNYLFNRLCNITSNMAKTTQFCFIFWGHFDCIWGYCHSITLIISNSWQTNLMSIIVSKIWLNYWFLIQNLNQKGMFDIIADTLYIFKVDLSFRYYLIILFRLNPCKWYILGVLEYKNTNSFTPIGVSLLICKHNFWCNTDRCTTRVSRVAKQKIHVGS